MKTDSLFYRIFSRAPDLFFELIQQPGYQGYSFQSVEVKQTAFRLDGVFLPDPNASNQPVFFVEVQFQKDPLLYHRLFAEIFLFLEQNPTTADWQAVVLFPRRSLEPQELLKPYRPLLDCDRVQRLYLNEIEMPDQFSPAIALMQLVIASPKSAAERAKQLVQQVEQQSPRTIAKETIIDLVETALVYKFPQLSYQEIATMLGLAESIKQTRVYQEGLEDGLQREKILILRLLTRQVGELPPELQTQLDALSLEQMEQLGEALLDFSERADLLNWLQANAVD